MKLPKIPNLLDRFYPRQKSIDRYITLCQKRPFLWLGVCILVTVLSIWGTIRLYTNVDTSLTALLPEHFISVATLKRIDQEGSRSFENILAEGNDPDELIRYGQALKERLEHHPDIDRVDVKTEDSVNKRHALLSLERDQLYSILDRVKKKIARAKLKRSGFFVSLLEEEPSEEQPAGSAEEDLGLQDIKEIRPFLLVKEGTREEYFLSRDQKILNILIFPMTPPSDFLFAKKLYEVLTSETQLLTKDFPSIKPNFYGPYRKRLDEFKLIQHDVNWIGGVSVMAIIVSLILYFRRFLAVLLIMIPLFIGLFATMGISNLAIGHLNTMTAFLVGILSGLGVDFCIHLFSRYLGERREGLEVQPALSKTLFHTGRAAFTSGMNTSLVFLSLTVADFRGFSEFGFIAGLGLMTCFVTIFLVFPFCILWFEKFAWLREPQAKTRLALPWPHLPTLIPETMRKFPFSRTLIAFSVLVVFAFLFTLPRLEFEYDFGKLRSDMIHYKYEEALRRRFNVEPGREGNAALLIMNSREDIPAVRKAITKKIEEDTETPSLRGFYAFDDMYPSKEEQAQRKKIIDQIRQVIDNEAMKFLKGEDRRKAKDLREYLDVEIYGVDQVHQGIIKFFSPKRPPPEKIGSYGYVLARPEIRTKDGRDAMRFANDVREIETERGTFYASSQEVVFADVLGLMLRESKWTVLVAFALLFFFVFLDFGSLGKTLLILYPLCCGLALTLVLLHAFGGKLTFYNILVIPMIIGMGEDNAVHIYHRYTEEGRGSICKALKTTGMATWMASLTTILGFVGLILSHHNGLKSMGVLATAGLFGCLICNLLVLPAMIQLLEKR